MKKFKQFSENLLNSDDMKRILSREERKKIMGGSGGCDVTETATTCHCCDAYCGIDKDSGTAGYVCCLTNC